MSREATTPWRRPFALAAVLLAAGSPAIATDGQILINQAKALAGGVTPGDAPGFPVTISQAGSYKLVGNLTVPDENTTAVEIEGIDVTSAAATDVSLDLNGFAIVGPTVCPVSTSDPCAPVGSGDGIDISFLPNPPSAVTVAIHNGTVRGMGRTGIAAFGGTGGMLIDRIRAVSNGFDGIFADSGIVTNCIAIGNGNRGISSNFSTVHDSLARGNRSHGISAGSTSGMGGNISSGNAGMDLSGGIQISPNVCGSALCP